ncbi:MAG: hypothetical protein K6F54_05620 [Lachnospiraceae bacterium]|nr:hypothetical protein [Lachnospiraceae bacterium]
MACFIVPASEAIVTTITAKVMESKEKNTETSAEAHEETKIHFSEKLGWLNKMLWGGSALLAFEHIWHGEVVPFFPFLTAVEHGETADMLAEMGTAGVGMALLVTAVWGVMVAVSTVMEKKQAEETENT